MNEGFENTEDVDWTHEVQELTQVVSAGTEPFAAAAYSRITNSDRLVEWLQGTVGAAREGRYVIPPPSGLSADTIWLWLNEFVDNTGEWALDPRTADHLAQGSAYGTPWDNRIGIEIADLKCSRFRLEGLEDLQAAFESHGPEDAVPGQGPVERLVIALVAEAVTGALEGLGDIGMRFGMSRGDEPRAIAWEYDGSRWVSGNYLY